MAIGWGEIGNLTQFNTKDAIKKAMKDTYNASLSYELGLEIPMFGLAKRIEKVVLSDCDESMLLDRHSNALISFSACAMRRTSSA